jgi:hypothetical protein
MDGRALGFGQRAKKMTVLLKLLLPSLQSTDLLLFKNPSHKQPNP